MSELFSRIVMKDTRIILCSIFNGENVLINPLLSTTFVDAIRNCPCSKIISINSKADKKPELFYISQVSMMLTTSRLIGYKLTTGQNRLNPTINKKSKDNNNMFECFLSIENGIPLIYNDNNWDILPLKQMNFN